MSTRDTLRADAEAQRREELGLLTYQQRRDAEHSLLALQDVGEMVCGLPDSERETELVDDLAVLLSKRLQRHREAVR